MLKITDVCVGYGGVDVVRNVSFDVDGSLCIVGPNGCGKTTLLKAIAGILPHRGEITLFGKPFTSLNRREISLNVALLSQQPSIYFAYSIYDTVMMGRYLHIKNRLSDNPNKEDRQIVEQSLAAVGLLAYKDKDITKLSGGQLQRVFLARALAQQPCIILLDEPTNHLDLKCQIEIINYLKDWASCGERAVVGVLHDINLAMRLSNSLILMKDGKIVTNDIADNIINNKLFDDVYEMDVAAYMKQSLEKWRAV
ncbi:MAG: ABC transporter ATP-binding protein [Defluviitaleaceae bacterium]|nr:ABC transporter ATP-binding protein [Defluviitaleaceae bacterium]